MLDNEFDYYVVIFSGAKSAPLLDEHDEDAPRYLAKSYPIEDPELMIFEFGDPLPRKPRMVDYHSSPDSVVSKKIFDVLNQMKIDGIQLLPAIIKDLKRGIDYDNYWAIHIYHEVKCIDVELSDCEVTSFRLSKVKKIVLDKKVLEEIPLKERLVFRLEEDSGYKVYHKLVVDAILAVNPEGIKFVPIEEFSMASFF